MIPMAGSLSTAWLLFSGLALLWSWESATPFAESRDILSTRTSFASSNNLDVSLRVVSDSGVCETTPGVGQMSGYIDVGTNMSMWFWFFESRESPETAPLTLWLNGGPGCSSMIGLFQEHGPCRVNADGATTTLNPYSWNNISNMIYIDQPIGTGFSYGTDAADSTFTAAPFVWQAFQVLFESGQFSKFQTREFILATESYGGHYGPEFVTFFNQQNALIDAGQLTGEKITVSALMINNGWFDPVIQNEALIDFATNAPGYGQLQSSTVLQQMNQSFFGPGGCKEQEEACYAAGNGTASNGVCHKADNFCGDNLTGPAIGDLDPYDLRQNSSALFPPEYYVKFLRLSSTVGKIGAETQYNECPTAPYLAFATTGDGGRTFLPQLGALVNSGLKTLIWAGDTDIICNWLGVHASVLAMNWSGNGALNALEFQDMKINGKPAAAFKNVGNFSFARVYKAGHEVPAFQPQASLEIFKQIVNMEPLHSVTVTYAGSSGGCASVHNALDSPFSRYSAPLLIFVANLLLLL